MKYLILLFTVLFFSCTNPTKTSTDKIEEKENDTIARYPLTQQTIEQLARLPLECIQQEYPNKTGHSIDGPEDATLTPAQLHPSFYGCFDWHSSVHGHWLLVKALKLYPDMPARDSIINILHTSFQAANIQQEAAYFKKYKLGPLFERTYGWAWVLKLDEELFTWEDSLGKQWHKNLQPLTQQIINLWKAYLPKQTYPNRTGVHPNTAFGLRFAIDWAQTTNSTDFLAVLQSKAKLFYAENTAVAAIQEPDGSDFFSPSLYVADLMTTIYSKAEYATWFDKYFNEAGLQRVMQLPTVSDRNDYQIVHLDGLMLSRAWNMKHIADHLPNGHPHKTALREASYRLIKQAMEHLSQSNYGGQHWLGSFALYALTR